jgi:hypothetical protein
LGSLVLNPLQEDLFHEEIETDGNSSPVSASRCDDHVMFVVHNSQLCSGGPLYIRVVGFQAVRQLVTAPQIDKVN